MKNKYVFLIFTLLINIFGCHHYKIKNNFSLDINFKGNNSNYLMLNYRGLNDEVINDTIYLINNNFTIKGKINGAVITSITSNIDFESSNSTNTIMFFLETGSNKISLEENNFKEAKIESNKSQKEYENLQNIENHFYKKMDLIKTETINLRKLIKDEPNKSKQYLLDSLVNINDSIWDIYKKELDNATTKFVIENPNSYVSPYALNSIARNMSLDSLFKYYNALSVKVKDSYLAKKIMINIDLRKMSEIGSMAPKFTSLDVNGDNLSLISFKGRYVLLDFWASWCMPCKEKHPELKKLYLEYKNKGLEIIGISFDKDEIAWRKGIEVEEIDTWNHIYVGFQNVRSKSSIPYNYYVQPIPAYILIDRNGFIIGRYSNSNTDERNGFSDLKDKLKEIFETTH